jgi:hypothetical protein
MNNIPVILFTLACSLGYSFLNAQTAVQDNKVTQAITYRPIPSGKKLVAVFEGRPPCSGLKKQLNLEVDADCVKLKWELILFHDSITLQPTTFTLNVVGAGDVMKDQANPYRLSRLNGKWSIIKGAPSNAKAVIFKLEGSNPGFCIYLLKGDDSVLFVLDEKKNFIPGNEDFSYTLNRVELVPGKLQ